MNGHAVPAAAFLAKVREILETRDWSQEL